MNSFDKTLCASAIEWLKYQSGVLCKRELFPKKIVFVFVGHIWQYSGVIPGSSLRIHAHGLLVDSWDQMGCPGLNPGQLFAR